jgi:hypothetical protein
MRLGAQCTVGRPNAQPANNSLEPAIGNGLLYEGDDIALRIPPTERISACAYSRPCS